MKFIIHSSKQNTSGKLLNFNDSKQLMIFIHQNASTYINHKYNSSELEVKNELGKENLAIKISASFFEKNNGKTILCSEYSEKKKRLNNDIDFEFHLFKTIHKKVDRILEVGVFNQQ